MTEIFFYHLEKQPLEAVLPRLLQTGLGRGWRAVVQASSEARVEAIASTLWTYDDEAFLPHGSKADGFPDLQPVWLTDGDDTPNDASVRFFVDGAVVGDVTGLMRAVILFDGADGEAVQRAREDWKRLTAQGHSVSYWRQDDAGRWKNLADS